VSPVTDERGNIIGASKVARDISERIQAQEALRHAYDELEERVRQRTAELRDEMVKRQRVEQERIQLLTRLVLAEQDERRRVARDLHDQLGQQLTALRLTLETLKAASVEHTDLRTQIETLQELAHQLDEDIAFRVRGLRSTVLENRGLAAALREYVGNWSSHFSVPVQLHTSPSAEERLPFETQMMMYRLVQEALNNVIKHARAERVDIVLDRSGADVSLIVEDNGVGFDPSKPLNGNDRFGLTGMRERAALVGADFQIESTPGRGTTVIVRAPAGSATARS
jgi:signal transduction histidine kinase